MFHTYVLTASRTVVDFDRASFLMDKDLLQQALDARREEKETAPRPECQYGAQWVWDYYCERHFEAYGEYFGPDVIPNWDCSPEPPLPQRTSAELEEDRKAIRVLTPDRAQEFWDCMRRHRPRRAKKP